MPKYLVRRDTEESVPYWFKEENGWLVISYDPAPYPKRIVLRLQVRCSYEEFRKMCGGYNYQVINGEFVFEIGGDYLRDMGEGDLPYTQSVRLKKEQLVGIWGKEGDDSWKKLPHPDQILKQL